MFPSYKTIVSRNNALFETNPLNGLTISQSFRFSPAILSYAINLPYLKVPFITDKFGQKRPIDPVTRIFQSSIILPYPNFQMILGVGSVCSAQISYTPRPWINFSSSIQSNLSALASISMSNSFSNLTLVFNPRKKNNSSDFNYGFDTNIFISGGSESFYACAQLSHESNEIQNQLAAKRLLFDLNSLLLGHQKDDLKLQWLAIINNSNVLANVLSIQNTFKNIKEKVPYIDLGFAVQLSNSNMEQSNESIYKFISSCFSNIDATIAWKTEVNGYTIRSYIKSSGVVQSTFQMKPNSVCDMTISGKLDHKSCDYTLGMSLNFL